MIKSMTGFGRCEIVTAECKISVEMKAVNHRYLDLSIKLPKKFNYFEAGIRNLLKTYIQRGKVDVFINYEDYTEEKMCLKYNSSLAAEYMNCFKQMEEQFGIKNDITVSGLARMPEVLVMDQVAEDEINPNGKVIDLVLPVAVLIVSAVGAMIYTGFQGGATNLITAFSGCDAETSLIFATLVTVFFMLILYLPRKVVTFKGFMDSLAEGFKLMVPAVTILIFAWSLKGMGDALGLAEFVGGIVGDNASASIFIPAILFVVAIFLSFSTGTSWGTFAILVPIATALFAGADNLTMMTISVSAVLAGAVCGDHISPISDTTVMSSAGAQSNHINHVSTQMQYAAVVATVSFVGYILAGIIRVWWIVLGISLILLIGVLMGMRMFLERKQVKKHAG